MRYKDAQGNYVPIPGSIPTPAEMVEILKAENESLKAENEEFKTANSEIMYALIMAGLL